MGRSAPEDDAAQLLVKSSSKQPNELSALVVRERLGAPNGLAGLEVALLNFHIVLLSEFATTLVARRRELVAVYPD